MGKSLFYFKFIIRKNYIFFNRANKLLNLSNFVQKIEFFIFYGLILR